MRFNPRARTGRDAGHDRRQTVISDCFNPRARTGRDIPSWPAADTLLGVSIHAPVRGATLSDIQLDPPDQLVSIHAPVRGATRYRASGCSSSEQFQSTRPYGARRRWPVLHSRAMTVSIHAPVRGATHASMRQRDCSVFQSTRPYGARRIAVEPLLRSSGMFQSTRPYGARRSEST